MGLEQVPDEIFQSILHYVAPEDNLLSVQLLSRRLHGLANAPLLWRHHCLNTYKYWNPEHRFHQRLGGPATAVDWKGLYILRRQRNARVARLLDGILASQICRLTKFEQICMLGYDAKDFLLEQCRADEGAEDALARR